MRYRQSEALDEDIDAIKHWERDVFRLRSPIEHASDVIAGAAGSVLSLVLHACWFGAWILINTGVVGVISPFDPFPFPLLTTVVSLEAIFLALFVLASQNRLGRQADKRSHLDLQIDLLAEREMTAVVQLLRDVARHLAVESSVTDDELRDLSQKTDLRRLTERMEEFEAQHQQRERRPRA